MIQYIYIYIYIYCITFLGLFSTKVAVLDKDEERGVLLKDKLENQYGYGRVIFIVCDVTSSIQMKGNSSVS